VHAPLKLAALFFRLTRNGALEYRAEEQEPPCTVVQLLVVRGVVLQDFVDDLCACCEYVVRRVIDGERGRTLRKTRTISKRVALHDMSSTLFALSFSSTLSTSSLASPLSCARSMSCDTQSILHLCAHISGQKRPVQKCLSRTRC
jgi:hypothetical protein